MADFNNLMRSLAAAFFVKVNIFKASSDLLPRIRFATNCAFLGATRTNFNLAFTSISPFTCYGAAFPLILVFRSPEWPWKVRVGENSPNLCPTISSVTKTGINFFPLWTANVNPTISGIVVDRLDQVLITFPSFVLRASSTFFIKWESTKGPFLIERAINLSSSEYIYQWFCFFGSSSPAPPKVYRGVCLLNFFPRLPLKDGRWDSSPLREPLASILTNDFYLLSLKRQFNVQGCRLGQWWHNNPGGSTGLHLKGV